MTSLYEEYIHQYPDLPNNEIAQIILRDENDLTNKYESVMRGLRKARNRLPEIAIKGDGRRGDSYALKEQYEFDFNGHVFDIPREEVAAICRWYPNPGGLEKEQICGRLRSYYGRDLTTDYLERILKCLQITRTSSPLAPHIKSEWDEDQLREYFLTIKDEKIHAKFETEEAEHWKKLFERCKSQRVRGTEMVEEIRDLLKKEGLPKRPSLPTKVGDDPSAQVLFLSDWHVGKLIQLLFNSFNKDIYMDRVEELCEQVYKYYSHYRRPVSSAYAIILGDMLDGPMGDMHKNQSMGQDLHHTEQVLWGARGLSAVLEAFGDATGAELVQVKSVGGNHGRVTAGRDDDPVRFADQMLYVVTNEMCRGTNLRWHRYEDVLGSFMIHNTQVFLTHGERTTTNIRDLIDVNGSREAESYLLCTGHYHSLNIEEMSQRVIHVRGGSLCGTDEYAARHGKASRASQLIIEVDDRGLQTIKPLVVG